MRCIRCGHAIKYENGRWHHYRRQRHWAVPPRYADPFNNQSVIRTEKEVPVLLHDGIPAWLFVAVVLIIILVMLWK